MPLLHSHHVDSCRSCQFAILVRQQDRRMPRAREPRVLQNGKKYSETTSYASFVLAILLLFTYIPVMLLVLLNSIILIKLKTQAHPGEQSTNTRQQRNRRDRNVLQMSIVIVTVFVLCLLPCATTVLITEYQDRSSPFLCSFCIYDVVTLFMAIMYCVINPVICFLFSSIINEKLLKDS